MTRWISEDLGTAAWGQDGQGPDVHRVDVRDLVDKGGNAPAAVMAKIEEAVEYLSRGRRVVVCCDYGMSRSNAVAAGVLAAREVIPLEAAVRRVLRATGETAIRLEVLASVRAALGAVVESAAEPASPGGAARMQRLLITGGSGFIGSAIRAHVPPNVKVTAPNRRELELLRDTVDLDLLVKEQGIDAILHLATPRVYTTNESMGASLLMLKNVLDVCEANRLFLFYLSSWEVYSGYNARELCADEALGLRPGGTYGQTKYLSEALIAEQHRRSGLQYNIIRSSPVYGLGSDRPKFIWNFLKKAITGADIVSHKYLNGFPALDLLHIDDLCRALTLIVCRQHHGTFNIGTGVATSTAEVARLIVEAVDSTSKVRHETVAEYWSNVVMDATHAAAILNWTPKVEFKQGISEIIAALQHGTGVAQGFGQ